MGSPSATIAFTWASGSLSPSPLSGVVNGDWQDLGQVDSSFNNYFKDSTIFHLLGSLAFRTAKRYGSYIRCFSSQGTVSRVESADSAA